MRRLAVINVKKHFKRLLFCSVGLLIGAQVLLTVPGVRQALSYVDSQETFRPLEQLTGELTLTLVGAEPSDSIQVLQNGEPIGAFDQAQITVPVQDNSVIEICGVGAPQPFSVQITKKSSNITSPLPQSVEVGCNIAMVGRIFVK